MGKKIFIIFVSFLTVFFLTAQACSFGPISTGLSNGCVGVGDIVCDDADAFQCQLATYGIGYYVTRAPAFDTIECGAVALVDTTIYSSILYGDADTEGLQDKVAVLSEKYTALKNDFETAVTFDDYVLVKRSAIRKGEGVKLIGNQLNDLEMQLNTETADVSTYQTEVNELQTSISKLYSNLVVIRDQAQLELDAISPWCDTDADCSGYNCGIIGTGKHCESNCIVDLSCDTDAGYVCDTSSLTCVSSGAETDCSSDSTICAAGEVCSSTAVCKTDTDGDGLSDTDETYLYNTDPLNQDTDGDVLTDGDEVVYGTDSLDYDSDADFIPDGVEVQYGKDPNNSADYPLCSSTDGGGYYSTYGQTFVKTADSYIVYTEYCNSNTLYEYYCDGDTLHQEIVDCVSEGYTSCDASVGACVV